MFDFNACRLADAEISEVSIAANTLRVAYTDWRGINRQLVFIDVVGFQWFSPEGRALSHGVIEQDEEFRALACKMADEDSVLGFNVYSFICAWSDSKILRVVAREVIMAEPQM